jgi:hypothetical protein
MGLKEPENQLIASGQITKNNHIRNLGILRLIVLWISPILLISIYDFATYLLKRYPLQHIPLPTPTTVTSVTLFGVLASPFWVLAGYSFTYLFGSYVITYIVQLFSHSKLFRRKLVLQTKEELEEIHSAKEIEGAGTYLSPKFFAITLGLVLALNLAYTLLIIRYFQNFLVPSRKGSSVYQYLLSIRFISIEFSLALLFLPLLTIVITLFIGRIRIRQIDSSPLQNYWLGYVYSAAGGASAILLLLNIFEHVSTTTELIIASLFVYGIVSWYTALGINLAVPITERNLARRLSRLGENKNIYYGKIFVGTSQEDAKQEV